MTDAGKRRFKAAGMFVGVALFAAAIVVVWRRRDVVLAALGEIQFADSVAPSLGLLALVAANVVLTGLMFSILISKYGRVGLFEMQALVAASGLLNYLPLRPGLFGRVAYHKTINNIAVRDSVRVLFAGLTITIGTAAYLAAAVFAAQRWNISVELSIGAASAGLTALLFVPTSRTIAAASLVRLIEFLVWTARYKLAFHLLGLSISVEAALAMACASSAATFIPFVSNGLGVREWAIGLIAPLFTIHQMELGITAELVNRAAELVVVLILGSAGLACLAPKFRRMTATPGDPLRPIDGKRDEYGDFSDARDDL